MEIDHLRKKIPELSSELNNLKSETRQYINNVYVKIKERPQKNIALSKKTSRLSEEMDNLKNTIQDHLKKDVPRVSKEINDLATELQKSMTILSAVSRIVRVHEGLINVRNFRNKKQLIETAKEIESVFTDIKDIETEEEIKQAMEKIKMDLHFEGTLVRDTLNSIFAKNIIISTENEKTVSANAIKVSVENDVFKEALIAFHLFSPVIPLLHKISDFILNFICQPIISNSVKIDMQEQEDFHILILTYDSKSEPPFYKEVLGKLLEVFQFFSCYFNYQIADDLTVLCYISNQIKKSLAESLITQCLSNTVPSNEVDLKKYDQVIADVENFQTQLQKINVLGEDETPFTEYVKQIDTLYINKKCQEYVMKAKTLMKKDLHEMVEVGVSQENESFLEEIHEFPKSFVSKSTIEILNLVEAMLQKATESSEVCAGRLIYTAQNILCMYGSVVTEYHQKMIQTIPQQVALFKNNCWYLAYQLNKWNEIYQKKLPPLIKMQPPLFKDQVHHLRTFGVDVFQEFVHGQVQQIEEILQNSHLNQLQSSEKLDASTEKAVRQCLRQQELLRTVWHKVLSYKDYNETLGFIFNSFCDKLVTFVLAAEDISTDVAEQLVEAFKIVQTRGPKLFSDPKKVNLYAELWYRFNEVVFILNASLVDINDRWADGKGPLALALKPEEVKRLIRALFQNTDRRAAVLAKIN